MLHTTTLDGKEDAALCASFFQSQNADEWRALGFDVSDSEGARVVN